MADKNAYAPVAALDRDAGREGREQCCIHTKKIYDACRDKDCSRYNIFLTKITIKNGVPY